MCIGGGGGTPAPPPAPAPIPKVMTATNLGKSASKKQRETGGRKRGARKSLVIPKTGVQYTSSGSGVNV